VATDRAKGWLSGFEGPADFEIQELAIAASGDVAFSHSLNRYSGSTTQGGQIDMWVRATAGYRKINGEWRIVHEHSSIPFNPGYRFGVDRPQALTEVSNDIAK
jgi:ketosteroid isomerase-like protein